MNLFERRRTGALLSWFYPARHWGEPVAVPKARTTGENVEVAPPADAAPPVRTAPGAFDRGL